MEHGFGIRWTRRGRGLSTVAIAGAVVAGCTPPASTASRSDLVVLFGAVVSIAATLALIHLLLYAFESRDRRNLYFTLQAAAFALVTFLDYREVIGAEVVVPGIGALQRWAVSALIVAIARFVFSLFSERAPRRMWLYTGAILLLLLIAIPRPDLFDVPAGLLGLLVTADALATLLGGWRRLRGDTWIVAFGAVLFALCGLAQLGLDLVGRQAFADLWTPYLWGGLALLLASSIYLARTFARTRHELEQRLVEVQELSARALAQEQAAREEEVRRVRLEAENERRGRELEEARRLQLAMLPQVLPAVPACELAARMITATEVGGDYYDAATTDDGTLWLAVGDAVGHGARAGGIVAVAKGLFAGIRGQSSPAEALRSFHAGLRGLDVERAHLALVVARLRGGTLELASAGMPPVLVLRAGGEIEEVVFSTLPLGAPLEQVYEDRRLELAPGDLVVFLSDGLIELPGDDDGLLGYDAVRDRVASTPPADGETLAAWMAGFLDRLVGDETPPDDVTLLALQRL